MYVRTLRWTYGTQLPNCNCLHQYPAKNASGQTLLLTFKIQTINKNYGVASLNQILITQSIC